MLDHTKLITEPAEVYHANAAKYLSSHQLMDYMECPLLHQQKRAGLIPDSDSPAYLIGRAAHAYALEGREVYDSLYIRASEGPKNPKTGKPYGAETKKTAEWKAELTQEVLTDTQANLAEAMAASVLDHAKAAALLTDGQAEAVIRGDWEGMECQIRIDWLNFTRGIVDLKTCDNLKWFENDAKKYRYANQLSFYREILGTAGWHSAPVWIIAVEKRPPYRVGIWRVSEKTLADARSQNYGEVFKLRNSLLDNKWPTGYEAPRILHFADNHNR